MTDRFWILKRPNKLYWPLLGEFLFFFTLNNPFKVTQLIKLFARNA